MTMKLAEALIQHVRAMSNFAVATSSFIGTDATREILEANSALENAIQQEPIEESK